MPIEVLLAGSSIAIDDEVFRTLLDNSVAGTYKEYENSLARGTIAFGALIRLARRGEIPYPLFFAPLDVVESQVEAKTRKLLEGVSKDTFSIGSRARVELHEVELIVKDLMRKQELLKRHDKTLGKNKIVGLLRRPGATPDHDAARLSDSIGLRHDELRACRTKEKALDLLIDRLERNQILVSRSVQHYMPQRLTHVKFSGMTIRDTKVPFVFLAGGDHGDAQEPVGRTIFTLALMTVLIGRRIFAPMTWDGASMGTDVGREYDIAGALLMPRDRMTELAPTSLEDMKKASEQFKVTASAVTVRAMRLSLITGETAAKYLDELRVEYNKRKRSKPMNQPRPENAVRKYNGRELTRRMLDVLDSNQISTGDFCRSVCLNRIKPYQIEDLRRAIS
ncbi:hypothetical protein [Glutamicibacter sp. V16R2B1]|uniref:ImmA/IrrE family metallo-endopeptidase n=1 Tax=Glutamicibacter sp. V16R2B1 TaxID=2036207 RepID=UPI0010FEACC3|nr:hypothetical protein [Glutamicibacter sp. V16R2B1]TLK50909.1 hypothetical protein FDN03_10790 [Glutamicibacter sp. V16R2B1]